MQHSKLLDTFLGLVNRYAQHQQYIERAKSQAKKFRPSVIERVVSDHGGKSKAISREVEPHVDEMKRAISALGTQQKAAGDARAKQQTLLEELELRQAIGELDDDSFKDEASGIQTELDRAEAEFEELSQEHGALTAALQRWKDLSGSTTANAPERDRSERPSASRPKPAPVVEEVEEIEPIDAIDPIDEGPGPSDSAKDGNDDGWSDVDDLGVDEPGDESADGAAGWEDENIRARPTIPAGSKARAKLLYQEATADEQTYPIHTEVITIGRGRNNDIQVKNDSKVSRVHCKLFERGNQFFIEDNKSSNGTLVNGELITERRLFGGEELIIGETFFRFQIGA